MENKVAAASSPDFWGRTLKSKKKRSWKRQRGRINWGSVQSEAPKTPEVMCEFLLDAFVHVKSIWSLQSCGVPESGVHLHRRDAEFFPLRSQQHSSASHCSTKTHRDETRPSWAIIRGEIQTIFSTQWELRAVKTAQRPCTYKSQLLRQDYDADLRGWVSVSHFRKQLAEKIFTVMSRKRHLLKQTLKKHDTLRITCHDYGQSLVMFSCCVSHVLSLTLLW